MSNSFREFAIAQGPLATGEFRTVVAEGGRPLRSLDLTSRADAIQYANDVAWETEHGENIALVFDSTFTLVHRGRR